MGRKEKLLAEWVKRGDLPRETLTSGAGHGRVDGNAPANGVPTKEKLLAEWVKRGDLSREALTSGAGHGRVDGNTPANGVRIEEELFPVDEPILEIYAEDVHGDGRKPGTKRVVRPQAERRSSVVPIILGAVAVVCIVVIAVVVYLYYAGY